MPIPAAAWTTVEVQRTGDRKDGYVLRPPACTPPARLGQDREAYRKQDRNHRKSRGPHQGGLVVDIGVRAFLPASQADTHPVRDLVEWKDRELAVRVLKMNRKRGNVVVSRRAILDEQVQAQRQAMLDSMAEGQTVRGVVKNVTGYGAFVDLGCFARSARHPALADTAPGHVRECNRPSMPPRSTNAPYPVDIFSPRRARFVPRPSIQHGLTLRLHLSSRMRAG